VAETTARRCYGNQPARKRGNAAGSVVFVFSVMPCSLLAELYGQTESNADTPFAGGANTQLSHPAIAPEWARCTLAAGLLLPRSGRNHEQPFDHAECSTAGNPTLNGEDWDAAVADRALKLRMLVDVYSRSMHILQFSPPTFSGRRHGDTRRGRVARGYVSAISARLLSPPRIDLEIGVVRDMSRLARDKPTGVTGKGAITRW
jgi:hypothetical protein